VNLTGFSPTDTIVSYSGLVWMGQLMATLQSHGLYLVLIVGGIVWGVVQVLRSRARLLDVVIYVILSFTILQALGGNGVSLEFRRSFAEQSGATATAEAAAQMPPATARVPRGFALVVSAIQDTVQELLPRINADFVREPFALFAATNSLMTEALQHDPALRARTADFLNRCYAPAITRWLQANPSATARDFARVDTPLSDELASLYPQIPVATADGDASRLKTCADVWGPLRNDLFTYATEHGGAWYMRTIGRALNAVGLGTDIWLRNILRQFRAGHTFGNAFNEVDETSGALASLGSGALSIVGFGANWVRVAQLVEIVRYAAFPLMGYLLAILYVAFPFVLAAAVLPGGIGRLVLFFALVASVKAWPLAWAVVDQVYGHVLPTLWPLVDRGWSAGNLIIVKPPAALNIVTGLMYVMGPVMLTTAFGIAGRSLGQGLSSFTTFRVATPIGGVG
jgi:TraG-like protein, N-terminal region